MTAVKKRPPGKSPADPASTERAAVASFRKLFRNLARARFDAATEPWHELAAVGVMVEIDPNRWSFIKSIAGD